MYSYTNRKGVTYYLHGRLDRKGVMRYTFKRSAEGALDALPEGHEVIESVNAKVSIRRARPRLITPLEEERVRAALGKHGLDRYRIEVKDKCITIFAPDRDPDAIAHQVVRGAMAGDALNRWLETGLRKQFGDEIVDQYFDEREQRTRDALEKDMTWSPVLRLRLGDADQRRFEVQRMTWIGDGGWHWLATLKLAEALDQFIPHLGKESFYDLV